MDVETMFIVKCIIYGFLLWVLIIFIIARPKIFFKDMPKDIFKKGEFIPFTFKRFIMHDGTPQYSNKKYKILLFAYIKARYLACRLDLSTKGDECGIVWGIHVVRKDN